jgi:hypothetical protein
MIMAQNIERSADLARSIRDQDPVAINPRSELRSPYRPDPGKQVSALLRHKPAALFLIEKHNGPIRKTLPLSPRNRSSSIGTSKSRRVLAFKLGIQASIEQDHEAKTVSLEQFPLARPGILALTRRIIKPISGEGKTTMQLRKELISGVVVSVKARGLRQAKVCQAERQQGEERL